MGSIHYAAINVRILAVLKYLPMSIARYWFIQQNELEQRRVKQLAQGFTRQKGIETVFS